MIWPFKKKEVSNVELAAVLGTRPMRAGADPMSLKEKLRSNRSRQNRGHGEAYWDSVAATVEDHYGLKS